MREVTLLSALSLSLRVKNLVPHEASFLIYLIIFAKVIKLTETKSFNLYESGKKKKLSHRAVHKFEIYKGVKQCGTDISSLL
jgi:hypothetical protein